MLKLPDGAQAKRFALSFSSHKPQVPENHNRRRRHRKITIWNTIQIKDIGVFWFASDHNPLASRKVIWSFDDLVTKKQRQKLENLYRLPLQRNILQ